MQQGGGAWAAKPSHATEARHKAYAARLQFGRRSAAPRCAVVLQPPELPLPRRTGSRRGLMNSLPFGGRPRESSSSREWARLATKLDRPETKGYAVGFAGLIDLIFSRSEERPRLANRSVAGVDFQDRALQGPGGAGIVSSPRLMVMKRSDEPDETELLATPISEPSTPLHEGPCRRILLRPSERAEDMGTT